MSEAQASMNGMIELWRALPNRPGLQDHGRDALPRLSYKAGAGKIGAGGAV